LSDPEPETLPALFLARAHRSPEHVAMHAPVGGAGNSTLGASTWAAIAWRDAEQAVADALAWLGSMGVEAGDRVAILGNPHPAWLNADIAVLAAGAVTVGIYPTLLPDGVAYILRHAEARLLLVESEAELRRLGAVQIGGRWTVAGVQACVWDPPAFGDGRDGAVGRVDALRAAVPRVRADQLCTLIYTSGTTGEPKGAMITHRAMVAVCLASRAALPLTGHHRSIVYLPLAHSLQRMAAYRSFLDDIEAWWCPQLTDLPATLAVARPTVLVAVPRVLEKMQARVEHAVHAQPALVRWLYAWAVGGRTGIQRSLAERLVLRKVRARLGGIEVIGVGGAALNVETARFFQAIGVEVLEAWGLTETCAPATLNRPGRVRLGTVGTPLDGVTIRLLDDGEVVVRGPGLFSGYWRDDAATARAVVDGWFHTGDIGQIDADGFLRIIDRKKELIVTAGGKNIAPVPIERALEGSGIGQAIVVGDARPFLVALFAEDPDNPPVDRERLARDRVAAVNATLPPYERIKRWAWISPLTVEDGQLTPTLKPKRRVIAERHAAIVNGMYVGAAGTG